MHLDLVLISVLRSVPDEADTDGEETVDTAPLLPPPSPSTVPSTPNSASKILHLQESRDKEPVFMKVHQIRSQVSGTISSRRDFGNGC